MWAAGLGKPTIWPASGRVCLGQTLNVEVPGQIAGVRQALGLPGGEQVLDPTVAEHRKACKLQLSSQFYSEDIDSIEEKGIKLAVL